MKKKPAWALGPVWLEARESGEWWPSAQASACGDCGITGQTPDGLSLTPPSGIAYSPWGSGLGRGEGHFTLPSSPQWWCRGWSSTRGVWPPLGLLPAKLSCVLGLRSSLLTAPLLHRCPLASFHPYGGFLASWSQVCTQSHSPGQYRPAPACQPLACLPQLPRCQVHNKTPRRLSPHFPGDCIVFIWWNYHWLAVCHMLDSAWCCTPQFSSVQLLSCVWLFATPWTAALQASLSIIKSRSLLKLMSIESVMPSNHLILCCPLLLPPSIFPSTGVFSNESALHIECPKDGSFSFNISLSNEYSGLISFRMHWLDLLAVQGTLKSLLQCQSSKVSILWCSAYFIVQLSHSYMTTGKTIALTRWTFVDKVMSLLFNMLSRLVIAFLPRSKRLLISWLQSPSAVILEPKKIVCHCFHLFPHLFAMKWWDWMPWS